MFINNTVFIIMFLFTIKHCIIDFMLETPYQHNNRHVFGHIGGLLHSQLHAFSSWLVLGWVFGFATPIIIGVAIIEFFEHYVVDYIHMKLQVYNGGMQINNRFFWPLLGIDQFIHFLTYIVMLYIVYMFVYI